MAKQQGKRGKSPDERPARKRYWSHRSLERKKVARIVAHAGAADLFRLSGDLSFPGKLTTSQARELWHRDRGGRRMKS